MLCFDAQVPMIKDCLIFTNVNYVNEILSGQQEYTKIYWICEHCCLENIYRNKIHQNLIKIFAVDLSRAKLFQIEIWISFHQNNIIANSDPFFSLDLAVYLIALIHSLH